MFAYVKGIVADIAQDCCVIDVHDVGMNIHISAQTAARMPGIGQEAKLYTYTSVREDAFWLYGFLSKGDLEMFKRCITVSGIGPKGALGLLSVMDGDQLRFAILAQDVKAISKAPGIGKRTAERLVLELKDKLAKGQSVSGSGESVAGPAVTIIPQNKLSEASAALAVLGYSQAEINVALKGVDVDGQPLEQIIRLALKNMVKG